MAAELSAATITKWTGLYRSVDPFAIAPGALSQADNVVVPAPSVLQPRRGFDVGTSLAGRTRLKSLAFFGSQILGTDNATTTAVDGQDADTLGTSYTIPALWTTTLTGKSQPRYTDLDISPPTLLAYGTNLGAMTPAPRWFTANGNAYLGTNFGALRISQAAGSALSASASDIAGLAQPVGLSVNNSAVLTGSYLPADSQVAYRLTFKFEDAAGNVHISPPTARVLFNNSAGPSNPLYPSTLDPYVQLPDWRAAAKLPPDWYEDQTKVTVQIWRTAQQVISSIYPDSCGDEMFLIAEVPLTDATWATQYVDNTPDIPWLQVPLYTNPTTGDINGFGIANANQPPPIAYDIFPFKGRTYYANTQEVQRLRVQIIGTGGGGIVDGDTVVIDGTTFKFLAHVTTPQTGAVINVPLYFVGNAYAPQDSATVLQGIELTARALVACVQQQFGGYTVPFPYSSPVDPQHLKAHILASYASPPTGEPGQIDLARYVPGAGSITVTAGTGAGRGWAGSLVGNNVSDPNRQPANLMQSHFNDPESVPPAFTEVVGRAERPILRGVPLRDTCCVFKGQGDGLWKFTDDGDGNIAIGPLDPTINLVAPETAVALNNSVFCLTDQGVLRITDGGSPENISNDRIQDDLNAIMAAAGATTLATYAFGVAYEAAHSYILCLPAAGATSCSVQYVYNIQTDAWTRWTIPAVTCGGVNPYNGLLYFGRDTSVVGGNILWVERKSFTDADFQDPGGAAIAAAVTLLPLGAGEPLKEKQWQNVYFFLRNCTMDTFSVSYSTEKQATPLSYTLPNAALGTANVILKLALDQAAARSSALVLGLSSATAAKSWQLSALSIPFDPATTRPVR